MPYGQGILPDGDNNENSSQGLKNTHTYGLNEGVREINELRFILQFSWLIQKSFILEDVISLKLTLCSLKATIEYASLPL